MGSERKTGGSVSDGDGRGRGDGDGDGDGSGERKGHPEGATFTFTSGKEGEGCKPAVNAVSGRSVCRPAVIAESERSVRRPLSVSYKEKLLSPGDLGFLVNNAEADDIVSGWKGFFTKRNAELENMDGVANLEREEDEAGEEISQFPVLSVTEEQYTTWCKPWMNSLIIKVLGLSVPKHVLFDRVRRMWKPKQPLKVVPLSNEYYIVSFSSKEDRDYALYEGPWMLDDHYLLVQRWRPNFNPWRADRQRRIAVWVRIPYLPLEFCTVESLGLIGNMIGKVIKIDRSTSIYDKGAFARICVEIDLQRPLLPAFMVFGETKQLVYEGLHLVCFGCGLYGHEQKGCLNSVGNDGVNEANLKKDATGVGSEQSKAEHVQEGKNGVEQKKEKQSTMATQGLTPKQGLSSKVDDVHRRLNQGGGSGSDAMKKVDDSGGPVNQSTGVDYARSSRLDFLGPHMLLRRESRRSSNGVEGSGGVKHGIVGVKIGAKVKGGSSDSGCTRVEPHLLEKKKEIVEGPDLKKSNEISKDEISKDVGKAKSEWIVVGSKRKKKEEIPKTLGKENRMRGRPKTRPKEIVDGGAHFVDVTNHYSLLQTTSSTDAIVEQGKLHESVVMEGTSRDFSRTEKDQALELKQNGDQRL
ncbi:hypothetical protein K1719_032567 [Acacia pycnantha]|nr:hypothetical protein K1719_032567 [Acacia pycnantha]